MISSTTILHLQTIAATLMGYDYFVSESLKNKFNTMASNVVFERQNKYDYLIKKQVGVFKTWIPTLVSGIVCAVICFALYLTIGLLAHLGRSGAYLLMASVVMLVSIYFIWRAIKSLMDVFSNGIVPFTFPVLFRAITTFLLFSSKGSIAAMGMLFLIVSFVCRYINAYAA